MPQVCLFLQFRMLIQIQSLEILRFFLTKDGSQRTKPKFRLQYKDERGEVTRRLNIELLSRFPWLAVSRHQEHEGLVCSVCGIMRISNSVGGWSALSGDGRQKMGRLVLEPLKDYSNLTEKDGALTKHVSSQYHMNHQCRAAVLLASSKTKTV